MASLAITAAQGQTAVTYTGYALLFVALVWMLIDPRGRFRQLLRRAATLCVVGCVGCAFATAQTAAPRVLPQATAERFGQLYIIYNDRVCPMPSTSPRNSVAVVAMRA